MTVEEVRAEFERIRARWRFAGPREREQDFAHLQALLAGAQALAEEDTETLEVQIEDLVTQMANRIDRDNGQRDFT